MFDSAAVRLVICPDSADLTAHAHCRPWGKTVKIISMIMHGPRAVLPNERRVCLPKKLAAPLGLVPGKFVRVAMSREHDGELFVSVAPAPKRELRTHDPRRPRRLTAPAQLSLPAVLLDQVGVTREEPWVYFAPAEGRRGLRVIPAARVEMQVSPRATAEVMT